MMVYSPYDLDNIDVVLQRRRWRRGEHPLPPPTRGESVALVTTPANIALAVEILKLAQSTCTRRLAVVDLLESEPRRIAAHSDWVVELDLAAIDRQLKESDSVVFAVGLSNRELPRLGDAVDRIIVLVGECEARRLADRLGRSARRAEVALVKPRSRPAPAQVDGLKVVRAIDPESPTRDIAWLGRHLARTKLGIALGAGGAKGYAHIGVLQVLEEYGYTIDYVAGTSIGALIGAWLAQGCDVLELERRMRRAFRPENVAVMFRRTLSGLSAGIDVHEQICREATGDRTFDDLGIPLVIMAVDLNAQRPTLIREGPLWQAIVAATTLVGLYPPLLRGSQRLVDGVALVPVPTEALTEAGADLTIAVNLMSRETLPSWQGVPSPPPVPPPPRSGSRLLDTLLEVVDLTQLDSSIREAAKADLAITPRFGPSTWRDFHLGDLFLDAGRAAARERLPSLRALAWA